MPDIPLMLLLLALLIGLGIGAGILSGLLGVGGGIILVPGLFHIFTHLGYSGEQLMQVCLGTSLATIVVTSARSTLLHQARGAVEWFLLRRWGIGIVAGASLGVWASALLSSLTLQIIFGIFAILIGLHLVFGGVRLSLGNSVPTGVPGLVLPGLIGGISAIMGIGGGTLSVPLMSAFGINMRHAVATASGLGVLIALPATLGFMLMDVVDESRPPGSIGAVNLVAFIIIIIITYVVTPLGVHLAHNIETKPLKVLFGCFLILVALNMLRLSL